MKKIISLILILFTLLSLFSCTKNGEDEVTTENNGETEENSSPFDFVTQKEKLLWKDSLVTRLIEVRERYKSGPPQVSVALVDVNLDGIPELAVSSPGGTSGNTYLELVNIETGLIVGSFSPGPIGDKECGEFALYLDSVTKRYTYFGESKTRMGWEMMSKYLYTLTYAEGGEEYREKVLFKEIYKYEDIDGNKTSVEFFIGDTQTNDFTEYFAQKEKYIQRLTKIEGTDIVYIRWDSLEGENDTELANAMADSLINSTQVFVKGGELG